MKSILMIFLLLMGISLPFEMGRHPGQPLNDDSGAADNRLLITEIMFDPDPPVGLPSYEFVEWYNPGADTINLAGWQWVVGDKVKKLTAGRVPPGGYVIVCAPAAAAAFRAFGEVVPLESFPALRNTGDRLTLVNPDGVAVHSAEYFPGQFADALKAGGGWSLELTDLNHFCSPEAWLPSVDPSGGTPGRANSQVIKVMEENPPMLIRAAGYDDGHFLLLFSGPIEPISQMNNYSCIITPGPLPAIGASVPEYGFNGLFYQYPEGINRDSTYSVEADGVIRSCSGQKSVIRPVRLGFPTMPVPGDVVISEILFDPGPGQVEFVELYNRSQKVIELRSLILARADDAGRIVDFSDSQDLSYWLFPASYAVLTADVGQFGKAWPLADPATAAGRPDIPSLTNTGSRLLLLDRNQAVIDSAAYSPDWHYPYLADSKGFSLERIDFGSSGTDRANWFSASAGSGGSTPGTENSCALPAGSRTSGFFSMSTTTSMSVNPADPVRIAVNFSFDREGWFLKMNIYNRAGLPVREIFPFGLAGMEGIAWWDGLDSAQGIVPDGIYLIVADYYHPSGKKGRWKKACALVRAY